MDETAFDASSLIADVDEVEVEIINPLTKKKTGLFITVLSRDSDVYKSVTKQQGNQRFKSFGRKTSSPGLTVEELEEESLQLLVACTKSWRNMLYRGQEMEFTTANVRIIYENVPTIREQVDDAVHDRGNFKKR